MWHTVLPNCKMFISLGEGGGHSEKPHKTANKEPGRDARHPCHFIQTVKS